MKKEQLLIAKVSDRIKRYEKTGIPCATNFLDPAEVYDLENILKSLPKCFYGGYDNSERNILLIGSDEIDEAKKYLEVITIESSKNLSHREVLGTLIGLGVNRDVLGDIIIKDSRADVIILKDISKYILQNLDRVGREKVKVCNNEFENVLQLEENFKEIKTTVASLRADAIISAGIGVSRDISAKMIKNQKVKLNYKLLESSSKQMKVGDMLSIRGYGRVELVEVLGETRKDRIRVILKKN